MEHKVVVTWIVGVSIGGKVIRVSVWGVRAVGESGCSVLTIVGGSGLVVAWSSSLTVVVCGQECVGCSRQKNWVRVSILCEVNDVRVRCSACRK